MDKYSSGNSKYNSGGFNILDKYGSGNSKYYSGGSTGRRNGIPWRLLMQQANTETGTKEQTTNQPTAAAAGGHKQHGHHKRGHGHGRGPHHPFSNDGTSNPVSDDSSNSESLSEDSEPEIHLRHGKSTPTSNSAKTMLESAEALLSIPVYRYLLAAMAALYFTVTGVQYWGTSYMRVTLHAPLPLVNALFILCAATGPTSGVFAGGWVVDLCGGYKGAMQRVKALEVCCIFG